MRLYVPVSKKILQWIQKSINTDTLSPKISGLLQDWLNDQKQPTYNQILKVSNATGIPFGYFFLDSPPVEDTSLLEYRTIDSISNTNVSRNLLAVIHDMQLIQDWIRNNIIDENGDKNKFVAISKTNANNDKYVQTIREIFDIPEDWFQNVQNANQAFNYFRDKISYLGITIMMNGVVGNNTHRKLDVNEFRAFTLIDDYAPLIFINANDSIKGRLFSLIHELAHIGLGTNNLFNNYYSNVNDTKHTEQICNYVAAEILVPNNIFCKLWTNKLYTESNNPDYEKILSELSAVFKCSTIVCARKALDNGFINRSLYLKLFNIAKSNFNQTRQTSGGNYYATMSSRIDHRFFNRLTNSVNEGKTLYSDALRLTNTTMKTFKQIQKYMNEVNGYE